MSSTAASSELCEFMLGATKAAVLRSAIDDQRS
jgi:hypothetical protein